MRITEVSAKKFFSEIYPGGVGYDFAGRKMVLDGYGINWNIDHILPVSKGGTDDKVNLQCTHKTTNANKGDYTTWNDNGKTWQVKRVKGNRKKHVVVEIKED